ncbi:immunoglobulin-like domain-containing protein, partial [Brevibacillus sp. SYSU BS000544]|uniref:immunoglobulin-like domain-containing protein n=1 Tax=Brevibacillus sp. SYSU BS000544 TaxID=3416443 RepID=UPI003CE4684B
MSKKKSNMKKIAAAVVSTTLLFSLVNSAFASTPGVRIAPQLQQQAESVTTVSNEDQEEEITVKSITATNGSITVKLSDAPEEMPELEDFIFTKQINGKDATALKATGITWNKDTKTAYFTFKALNATKDAQKVVVNVDYNGSKKSAKLFTIAAKGAEVDKVQIINNAANATLLVGSEDDATLMLTAVAKDKDGNIVTGKKVAWSSSNAKVASVDKNGKVKAIASGKAVISATIDGKEATLKVTVTEPKVEKVEIENTADDAELVVGSNDDGSLVLKAVALDKNGKELKEKKIEWTSLAPMVATVDDKGKVTAIAVGKAKIKATVDGKSADFEVTVKANPSISLETNLLSESSANDGSISGTQTVTLTNGKFASDISAADVTVNNLPAGLGVGVTRNSDTQITIFFTGQAFSHTAADSKSNLSVTINKAKVSDAKENLVSGTFSITFADPVIVVPPPVTAPTQVVTGLTFPVDIDKDAGQIQGNLSWTPPSRTSNITHYSVYFLNNSNAKVGTKIVDIPVGTNSYAVPANTPIPSGATKFGVFAKNGAGENATGATVEFTDVSLPTALASTVTFTDEDIDVDQISGNVTWTAATDESNITHYAVYFLNADNSRGTQIGADVAKAGPLQVNIGADTAIPSGTTKIAVFSKNGAGLSTAGKEIMINDLVGLTDAQAVAGAKADLDDADLLNGNSALNNVTGNLTLPTTGINGTAISWVADHAAVGADGSVIRPANGSGDATVTLTATISKNGTQDTKTFTVIVKEEAMTDAQAVAGAKADLDDADLLNGNSALNNVTGNVTLPTTG